MLYKFIHYSYCTTHIFNLWWGHIIKVHIHQCSCLIPYNVLFIAWREFKSKPGPLRYVWYVVVERLHPDCSWQGPPGNDNTFLNQPHRSITSPPLPLSSVPFILTPFLFIWVWSAWRNSFIWAPLFSGWDLSGGWKGSLKRLVTQSRRRQINWADTSLVLSGGISTHYLHSWEQRHWGTERAAPWRPVWHFLTILEQRTDSYVSS